MKKTKLPALLLAILLFAGILAGCSNSNPPPETDPTGTTAETEPGTTTPDTEPVSSAGGKIYRTYETFEVSALNSHNVVEDQQTVYEYGATGLYRYYPNEAGNGYVFIGDLAAELPIKIDDYTWQIKLRENAQWNNGEPMNADTVLYSYKMQMDPLLINRMSDFISDNNITIVNALEYSRQGAEGTVDWEDVGIKKLDDYTIEITTVDANSELEVCLHFTDRSTYMVYEPLYEAGMNDTRTSTTYGMSLDEWMGSGPYTLTTWEYSSIYVFEKNPDHWLADYFNYDGVEIRIIPEMNPRIELWEQGQLDYLRPDSNAIETYIDDPRMYPYSTLTVHHIDINAHNPNNPLSETLEYRKALYHAMNREVIARDLFGYMTPTGTYVNGQAGLLSENALTYRSSPQGQAVAAMVEEWGPYGYNVDLAREYMDAAFAAAGLSDGDVVTIIYAVDADEAHWRATGEYLMEEFATIFEGKIQVEIVSFSGIGATAFKATGDDKWDLSPNEWSRSASRNYPYQAFYYYTSNYSSAPNNYFVDAFDEQFAAADSPELKGDYNRILDETQKLEEIYLEYVIHIPLVQQIYYDMFSTRVELPVSEYIPGLGWGTRYGKIAD